MKRKFLIFVTALIFGSSLSAFGQVPTTDTFLTQATLRATIVLTEVNAAAGLNFGTLDIPASGSTPFTINPVTGTQLINGRAAEWTVTGEAGQTYAATVSPASILLTGPGTDLTVGSFTVLPAPGQSFPSGNIFVGATVTIPTGQTAGAYTNAAGATLSVVYQ